jgi:pimeloyl-ACP methyl ester carboxylesterase
MTDAPAFLDRGDGTRLAYRRRAGAGPGVVWLGGFRSDMNGTKARALDAWAAEAGRALLRFDYFAHGASDGNWRDATIGRWRADALAAIDRLSDGPQILVGSSMGAWIALLAALARPERVKALVLIAPAVDLTEALIRDQLPFHARQALETDGEWTAHGDDGDTFLVTRRLIDEGRDWLLLDGAIAFGGPVRILQGWRDRDVPWSHAVRVFEALQSEDVELVMTKSGDHRLSTEADLARLTATIEAVSR